MSSPKTSNDLGKVIAVEYYPDRKLAPNNLDSARDSIHEYLFSTWGQQGAFIRTGKYFTKPTPSMASILRDTAADKTSVEYLTALDNYREETKAVRKFNAQAEDNKSRMFGDVYSSLKQSARDKISSAESFPEVFKKACDPLALWLLVEERLASTTVGDEVAVKGAARDAYNAFRQTVLMSIEDFNKGLTSRYESMVKAGWKDMTDPERGYDYVHKLNKTKYSSLIESVENGIVPYPVSAQKGYELALRWKTARPVAASSYAAESWRPPVTPPHRSEQEKSASASSYVSESKPKGPREEKKQSGRPNRSDPPHNPRAGRFSKKYAEMAERAAAAGFPDGSCFGCGSLDHKLNQCPNVKKSGGEDAHVTFGEDEYDYDGYYDEHAYFADGVDEEENLMTSPTKHHEDLETEDEEFIAYVTWIEELRSRGKQAIDKACAGEYEVDIPGVPQPLAAAAVSSQRVSESEGGKASDAEEADVTTGEDERDEANGLEQPALPTIAVAEEAHATEAEGSVAPSTDYDDESDDCPDLTGSDSDSEASEADLGDVGYRANGHVALAALEGYCAPGTLGLDTMTSLNIVSADFAGLDEVRPCHSRTIVGIGGAEKVNKVGRHPLWGLCFVRSTVCNLNLLSLGILEENGNASISYSQTEGTFTIRVGSGEPYVFKKTDKRVYLHAPVLALTSPPSEPKSRLVAIGKATPAGAQSVASTFVEPERPGELLATAVVSSMMGQVRLGLPSAAQCFARAPSSRRDRRSRRNAHPGTYLFAGQRSSRCRGNRHGVDAAAHRPSFLLPRSFAAVAGSGKRASSTSNGSTTTRNPTRSLAASAVSTSRSLAASAASTTRPFAANAAPTTRPPSARARRSSARMGCFIARHELISATDGNGSSTATASEAAAPLSIANVPRETECTRVHAGWAVPFAFAILAIFLSSGNAALTYSLRGLSSTVSTYSPRGLSSTASTFRGLLHGPSTVDCRWRQDGLSVPPLLPSLERHWRQVGPSVPPLVHESPALSASAIPTGLSAASTLRSSQLASLSTLDLGPPTAHDATALTSEKDLRLFNFPAVAGKKESYVVGTSENREACEGLRERASPVESNVPVKCTVPVKIAVPTCSTEGISGSMINDGTFFNEGGKRGEAPVSFGMSATTSIRSIRSPVALSLATFSAIHELGGALTPSAPVNSEQLGVPIIHHREERAEGCTAPVGIGGEERRLQGQLELVEIGGESSPPGKSTSIYGVMCATEERPSMGARAGEYDKCALADGGAVGDGGEATHSDAAPVGGTVLRAATTEEMHLSGARLAHDYCDSWKWKRVQVELSPAWWMSELLSSRIAESAARWDHGKGIGIVGTTSDGRSALGYVDHSLGQMRPREQLWSGGDSDRGMGEPWRDYRWSSAASGEEHEREQSLVSECSREDLRGSVSDHSPTGAGGTSGERARCWTGWDGTFQRGARVAAAPAGGASHPTPKGCAEDTGVLWSVKC